MTTAKPVSAREKMKEVGGLFFILCALFVFLSLVSFDSGDVAGAKYPANDPVANKGGKIGAAFAFFLYSNFGWSAFLLVLFAGFWSFKVFFRREIAGLPVKLVAVVVSLLAASTLLSLQKIASGLASIAPGPGGIYGRALEILLRENLGGAGAWLAVLLALAVSLILSTDWLLYQGTARLATWTWTRFRAIRWPKPIEPRVEAARAIEAEKRALSVPMSAPLRPVPPPPPMRPAPDPFRVAAAAEHKKAGPYEQPPIDLFESRVERIHGISEKDIKDRIQVIESTLREFSINARVVTYEIGPAVTTYELVLGEGQQISSIMSRQEEISMRLAVPPVRIVGPIPGKGTVGVEVPNPFPDTVRLREFLDRNYADLRKIALPVVLGKTNAGDPLVKSLAEMPHLLIAGATGSGKSVCLKSIITSLVVSMSWDEMKLLLIDPKMVELTAFAEIPHLWAPVVTDNKKAALVLDWLVKEMDERYMILNKVGVTGIEKFNKLGRAKIEERLTEAGLPEDQIKGFPQYMPYIVTVIDELADLMMTARKEVEHSIIRLSQKARAIGIHLVVATQRPSTDVITGLIRSNMPARVGFKVASQIESRIILDRKGAERLLGKGDMLLVLPGSFDPVRAQCTFVSDEEIGGVVKFLRAKAKPEYHEQLVEIDAIEEIEGTDKDEYFDEAVQIVLEEQRGSTSLLQRRLSIGYTRAARLIDAMEKCGIVGAYSGSSARDILISMEQWEARKKGAAEAPRR